MAKNITRHVQHIKSVDITTITVDGQDVSVAKLPEWGDLKDGEIAVNYKDGYETISIRNNNNEVVAFPNINTVNTLIEEKAQATLTFDTTPTANSTNPVTSGGIKTYVDNGDKIQALTTYQSSTPLAVGDTHDQALSKLSKIIDDNEIFTARALTDLNDTKQDEIEDLDVIRTGAALGATALQTETQLSKGTTTGSGNAVTDISVDNHQITLTKGATFLTEHQDLSAYADGAEYDSTNHLIYLKHGNNRLSNPINANDFIKDGMVDTVTVTGGNLVITFNTDSGKEDIEISLTDIFDPSLYYTKKEIDEHELVTAAALTELHDTKQELLTFDNVPTSGSSNPVTSSGIKNYVDNTVNSLAISELVEPEASTPLAVGDTYDDAFAKLSKIIRDNELATAGALTELHNTKQELLTFDSTPTADSTNPVTSGGIKTYVDAGDSIQSLTTYQSSTPLAVGDTHDQAFSKLSKIIDDNEIVTARALTDLNDTKQELLTFDSTPTANSQNPVTSEGIKEYVDDAIDASTPMTEITYSDLVTARNNNNLKPGTWYRITDYTTTTTQADTQSAGHNFDIIVLATSSNTLSEEARAIKHDGDTYFANSNLNAWKVWYCLDNDTARFAWADDNTPQVYNDDLWFTRDESKDKHGKFAWYNVGDDNEMFTDTLTPKIGDILYSYNGDEIEVEVSITAIKGFGRGVIYRLIDEFNNDIKYDFKNIQFKRKITDGQYDATNGTETWCYTLNIWYNDMCQDASIVGNTLPNSWNYISGVYDNVFGYATAYDLSIEGVNTFAFVLGDNVVLSFDDDGYFGIYNNTIGNSFYSNTIGNVFNSNIIGNYFSNNTIGNSFYYNTIGNVFQSNTIGESFCSNMIGDTFCSNMIKNNFSSNMIANEFRSNTIGNIFQTNTIGNNFSYNTIGNAFRSNTIGNVFQSNTIGYEFYSNTIGNVFQSNTIGARNSNTITTIDHVRYIRVEDGVKYVDITTSATTSDYNWLQNITIAQGVSGTSSTRKVITHPTVNDNFRTTYQSANSRVESV